MDPIAEEIFQLVKKKMQEQGAYTRDAYKQYIEETIEYFKEKGKLTDDDNEEFIEDALLNMYENATEGLGEEKY